jgi:hypothetical protein
MKRRMSYHVMDSSDVLAREKEGGESSMLKQLLRSTVLRVLRGVLCLSFRRR